ncbi:hypothetical protein [Treponema sp.]|uniref:hypothetical protein n=1 Tax=Treponema sp. TaxID=166 RepID=UPI00298E469B|nr:hypothetical protein [Treponema sp.]MCR5612814.1 hypothetical protein [Treponema sp.]
MKRQLNLHDSQILKIIINPISKTMQIILSHTLGKIMEIRIRCIKKIEQDNIDCLSLFFESSGGIDDAFIEERTDSTILILSGIINDSFEKYEIINWSFTISAEKIDFYELSTSESNIDLLYDNDFVKIDNLLG